MISSLYGIFKRAKYTICLWKYVYIYTHMPHPHMFYAVPDYRIFLADKFCIFTNCKSNDI